MAAYTQIPQPTQPCRAVRCGDSPCWLALHPAGGLPSGPGPLRSGLPPAGERLGAAKVTPNPKLKSP